MKWLEAQLKNPSGRKFIILDHIYAGGRFKHDATKKAQSLWSPKYNEWYFDLWDKYKDNIIIELAGHDHWEDVRLNGNSKVGTRNLIVSTGASPDHS